MLLVIMTVVNLACFLAVAGSFVIRGARLPVPWDGPALATVALTAATVVMAAVAIGVALLAVWGYTTLREHAANVASTQAREIAERIAATSFQAWSDRVDTPAGGQSADEAFRGPEP